MIIQNINKTDLTNHIPTPSIKNRLYMLVVTSDSNGRLLDLTTGPHNIICNWYGHPNTVTTRHFLAKHYRTLWKVPPLKLIKILCANESPTNSKAVCLLLNLASDLPASVQKGHSFNIMGKYLFWYQYSMT